MLVTKTELVATIVLDQPETRNALSFATFHELGRHIDEIAADPSLRFLILRGANQVFSSGGDLGDLAQGLNAGYVADYWQRMASTVLRLRALPQIVIAGVDGAAIGAGAALAMAADLVVATARSRFRWSFGHVGYVPDAGTALILAQALGAPRARDLLLTGRWMEAQEAVQAGLIARLADDDGLDLALADMVDSLSLSSPHSLALTKNLIDSVALPNLASAVRADGIYQLAAAASGDFQNRPSRKAAADSRDVQETLPTTKAL